MQRPSEDGDLLGQRTRSPVADPDFIAVVAHVLMPSLAPAAGAIAHHHVAHDAAADPRGVDPVANGGDGARPLMTEAHRIGRMPGVEIGHLAGEELDVGAADSHPFDVDDDLARRRPPVPARPVPNPLPARSRRTHAWSGRSSEIDVGLVDVHPYRPHDAQYLDHRFDNWKAHKPRRTS